MSARHNLKCIYIIMLALVWGLWGSAALAADNECVSCHTDADKLKAIVEKLPPKGESELKSVGLVGEVKPIPRWQRVLVTDDFVEDENHADLSCDDCHGGQSDDPNMETAHKDVVSDPSFPGPGVCLDCHDQKNYEKSLHYTLNGLKQPLMTRMGTHPAGAKLEDGFKAQCAQCHASCGQCHISRPSVAGGGLIKGHVIEKSPDMEQTCDACHGSRAGDEYFGRIPGNKPDVHFEDYEMNCLECHDVEGMHGEDKAPANRHQVASTKACVDCHDGIYGEKAKNREAHNLHKGRVSCQVCHAQAYRNCAGCHVNAGETKVSLDKDWADFKIGRNPHPTERHPEAMVLVRKVPVTRDFFKSYTGVDLPNYDDLPTWKMTAPHSIQRQTEQNSSCNNCHGFDNRKLYLLRSDVSADDRAANRPVTVPPAKIPKPVEPAQK